MKDVKINGITLRFDWGTVMLISSVTGVDGTNPLVGIPQIDEGKYILYGAMNRVSEKAGMPNDTTLDQAAERIKDFSASQYSALINGFINLMQVDQEEDITLTDEENKAKEEADKGAKKK